MARQIYDVIVIGTGSWRRHGYTTAMPAGANVCALNAGRRLNPRKDFRNHKQPYDMPFRGFNDPKKRKSPSATWTTSIRMAFGNMTSLYTPPLERSGRGGAASPLAERRISGDVPPRASAKSISGRRSRDGYDVDWPVSYDEMAPYYSRVERMIGVASTYRTGPAIPMVSIFRR